MSEQSQGTHEILVVDDEPAILDIVSEVLEEEGHRVQTAGSPDRAIELLGLYAPRLVLSDIMMPNGGIGAILKYIQESGISTQVIAMTAGGRQIEAELTKGGLVTNVISKPFDLEELAHTVNEVLAAGSAEATTSTSVDVLNTRAEALENITL